MHERSVLRLQKVRELEEERRQIAYREDWNQKWSEHKGHHRHKLRDYPSLLIECSCGETLISIVMTGFVVAESESEPELFRCQECGHPDAVFEGPTTYDDIKGMYA